MGMEFKVNSLEEMCDLMCGNVVPKKRKSKKGMRSVSRKTKKLTTYLIYYTASDGYGDGFEAYGYEGLRKALKWLHSDEVKATDISIYKHGKNFENDSDDIIEVYRKWWK